jgi:hypothetical protein
MENRNIIEIEPDHPIGVTTLYDCIAEPGGSESHLPQKTTTWIENLECRDCQAVISSVVHSCSTTPPRAAVRVLANFSAAYIGQGRQLLGVVRSLFHRARISS